MPSIKWVHVKNSGLQRWRAVRAYTQEEAAAWAGVRRQTWLKWEKSSAVPVPVWNALSNTREWRGIVAHKA